VDRDLRTLDERAARTIRQRGALDGDVSWRHHQRSGRRHGGQTRGDIIASGIGTFFFFSFSGITFVDQMVNIGRDMALCFSTSLL
jgi:hypothetical protein